MKLYHMSFTTARKARDLAGGELTPGFSFTDPYQLLAIGIIIRIRKDLHRTRDKHAIQHLLKWFDTPWGVTICDFIGVDSVYIKEVLAHETAEKHSRDDRKRITEAYPARNQKSEYTLEKHREA